MTSTQAGYFELWDDKRWPGRWHLGGPVDEQGTPLATWQFLEGKRLDLGGTPFLPVTRKGQALEFTFAAFNIPLVHHRVVSILERLNLQQEVQLFEARVEGEPEPYFILNPLRTLRCVDEARCEEVSLYEARHGEPDKIGQYRAIGGLRIDPTQVGEADIFRPWGWPVALIISQRVKRTLEDEGITGTRFKEV